jgi:hypothetical protein
MAIIARAWTPEQDDYLTELAGDVPPAMIAQHFNRWAKAHGYPTRTAFAISRRRHILGISVEVCGYWINAGVVARALGIPTRTVLKTFETCPIERKRIGRCYFFTRRELKRWAQRYPERLGGFPRPNLIMLLESEELVDWILERHPQRYWKRRKIWFPTLKRVFHDCSSAAKAIHVDHSTIPAAIKAGRSTVAGIPFEVIQ